MEFAIQNNVTTRILDLVRKMFSRRNDLRKQFSPVRGTIAHLSYHLQVISFPC